MMLGEVVSPIVTSFLPVDNEMALTNAISNPVEVHVDGLRAELLDCVIGDACCCVIVSLDRGGRLWVAQFNEACADGACFFTILEESSKFCFSST